MTKYKDVKKVAEILKVTTEMVYIHLTFAKKKGWTMDNYGEYSENQSLRANITNILKPSSGT